MDLIIVFVLFVICMLVCLILNISMVLPLAIGFILFSSLALKRGFSAREVFGFIRGSFRDSFIVIRIMLIIGCLTGAWRACGTIAYFITLGTRFIPPSVFLLAVFLLASVMSYALGTSFGVTATAGVILISIARAGGVSPILAAGAIYSGVYVGDRGSPAASSANLVAVLTHTDMRSNVKEMLKTSIVPFIICCVLYALLSFLTPVETMDTSVQSALAGEFNLHWTCLVPAVIMIILPFCGVKIPLAMLCSLTLAVLVSVFTQGIGIPDCINTIVLGFTPQNKDLQIMLSGGGIVSMLEVSVILLISGTYGGIFRGTGMLSGINDKLLLASRKIGRFPLMLVMSFVIGGMFCNQTIGVIMQNQLSEGLYGDSDIERKTKMLDIENSMILVAGLVPWCIACSVPFAMLDVDVGTLPFCFYLWLVPICYMLSSKKIPEN